MKSDGKEHTYDSLLHCGANSACLTAGLLIADVVGAGILSMAVAIACFGWLLGIIMVVLLMMVNVHTGLMLWRVQVGVGRPATYSQLVSFVSEGAPQWQRRCCVLLNAFSQYSYIFGALTLYILSIGQALGAFFHTVHICLPWWSLIGASAILPFLATGKHLGSWPGIVCTNVLTIVGSVIIPLIVMAYAGVEHTRLPLSNVVPLADVSVSRFFSGSSIMLFAFAGQFMLVEIMHEMKDLHEFPYAFCWLATPAMTVAFLVAGVGGYYFQGHLTSGMLTTSLPFGTMMQLGCVCLFTHMTITYLIKAVVLGRAIHARVDPASLDQDDWLSWTKWACIVTANLVVCWVTANSVPFFEALAALVGSLMAPFSCVIIPAFLYCRWCKDTSRPISWIEMIAITLECVFATVLMSAGTALNMQVIVANWDTYGYPFECHCRGLWSTCACSGDHAGMEWCAMQ